jgi:plasmid stabilization system protein ParE
VKRYLLTAAAEQDLDAIKIYLVGQGGPPLVLHVMDRLEAALQLLGEYRLNFAAGWGSTGTIFPDALRVHDRAKF